ncbi:Nitrogen assimilation transcription factor nit-4 [Fusarium oxysporum f. sp. rapae]|uniref:Nitrogen assimilation transcription factor nit-4 n=1 Tax=Fusarium oxysporum f. sp. rapae TaxID=485398 RepID=A0A8J5TMJ1_FUSOX|nr:Nitrogen assimilation transcription factor nit-4 [Fusarium oxysporum f. sp. rapae]
MDPRSADHHLGTFCSRFLINALLAVSCLYTLDPVTFKDPQDSKSRGRRWADEAEAHLESIDRPSIPLLQGLYALFAYEGNIGNGTKPVAYFMRCIDVYKALNDPVTLETHHKCVDETRLERMKQATSWCLWGFYCVEWRSSQAFGFRKLTRKPRLGRVRREPDFPLSPPDCIGYWWFPYPMSLQIQRAMQVEVRDADVKLSEIVEEALDFLYLEPGQHPPHTNPQRALELYDAFFDWKLSCPSRIRFEEAVLPSAILLHIGVEVMFTAILCPFSHMTKEQFGRYNPRELCNAHAGSLMSAVWTFRTFAQIRFKYYLCHPLGTAAYIVLQEAQNTPIQMDILIRAYQCLHEMSISLPLATDVLGGIRAAFKRKDGLMHHAMTALLPSSNEAGGNDIRAEMQLQELLDESDAISID